MRGDHALYYAMHLQEFMPAVEFAPSTEYKPLERNLKPEIRNVKQKRYAGALAPGRTIPRVAEHLGED